MPHYADVAAGYIALWNERDVEKRATMLASRWTEDAVYVDPLSKAKGLAEMDALVASVQGKFPRDFKFALRGSPNGFGEYLRFSWSLGPARQSASIEGTDFATLERSKIKSVTGFLDKIPTS
ncbi:nuclear transport factor 2 family protein [Rhodopseudomonas boonkerdii]|uniref:nuclear transport factor 2 family protein n=1 Tax=Rhodopseudomonas boonkerdii TaxID=475937 RepID=UPI001E540332|nr:nuclear transport factor 2 family protein [Rhodopseudomonas boonkerdii]UGV28680.1 nuclear transport factor 2 family protein [Rhodopseudomonas boonkerdii]